MTFTYYQAAIRWCYYGGIHAEQGWLALMYSFATIALIIPWALYHRIIGKKAVDLELL